MEKFKKENDYLKGITIWLKNVKKIKSIDWNVLLEMMPEYEQWLKENKSKS